MAETDITFVIRADTAQGKAAIEGVTRSLSGMGDQGKKTGAMFRRMEQDMNAAWQRSRRHILMVSAVVAAATIGLAASVKQTAQYGEEMIVAAQKTSIGIEQLQALRFAAEQSETSFESLTTGLRFLNRAMGGLAETKDAQTALAALKIEIKEADESTRPLIDVLFDIADKFHKMKDGAEKTAISMAVFGRSGTEMIPVLNMGSVGIKALMKQAEELGIVLGTKDVQAAAMLNDQTIVLAKILKGFEFAIAKTLIPTLNEWLLALAALAQIGLPSVGQALRDLLAGIFVISMAINPLTAALFLFNEKFRESVYATSLAIAGNKEQTEDMTKRILEMRRVLELPTAGGGAAPLFDPDAAERAKKAVEERESALERLVKIEADARMKILEINAGAETMIRAQAQETLDEIEKMVKARVVTHEEALAAIQAVEELTTTEIRKYWSDHQKELAKMAGELSDRYTETLEKMDGIIRQKHAESLAGIARIEYDAAQEIIQINQDKDEMIRTLEESGLFDAAETAAARVGLEQKTAEAIAAIEKGKNVEIAEEQERALDAATGKIESFIDRVFMQAKSLSDVFRQLLMQLLGSFVKWVSRMIAEMLMGLRRSAGQGAGGLGGIFGQAGGGGGGLLGTILGGILGGGIAGGGAITQVAGAPATAGIEAAFTGPLIPGAVTSLAMAAGPGGGIPSAAGGATAGPLGALAFGGAAGLKGLAPLATGGLLLGGLGLMGRRGGGAVSGALGGAMIGLGGLGLATFLGGTLGIGVLAGLAAIPGVGWIAAGVGAAIGALIGSIRRGRAKRKAAGLEQGFEFASLEVLERFKKFEVDYESALTGMQELIAQGQQTLLAAGLGRWGKRGAENLTRVIGAHIAEIKKIQKIRETGEATIAAMTVPEFQRGGLVEAQRGQLAILHPGEFVMRREAVQALGKDFFASLNRTPQATAAPVRNADFAPRARPVVIENLNVVAARGMTEREAADLVVRGVRRAAMDGRL